MQITEWFLDQLERERAGTRRVLERVPEGRNDWKPHDKSMPIGYLAGLVARMPAWVAMMITGDEHDLRPAGGETSTYHPQAANTREELLRMFDESMESARRAILGTTDDHLRKPWRLLIAGNVVSEEPRYVAIRDAVMSHWAHHRGQLTVYLRLNDAAVPSVYGPTADEPA